MASMGIMCCACGSTLRDWAPACAGEGEEEGEGAGFARAEGRAWAGFAFAFGVSIFMPGIITCCARAADGSNAATAHAVTNRGRFIVSPSRIDQVCAARKCAA